MIFDFEKFADIAARYYPDTDTVYTIDECLYVFDYFFTKYEKVTGEPHPNIKASQIIQICDDMPYIEAEDKGAYPASIRATDYPAIIDKYFETEYKKCNYRINHFFSGKIRLIKWLEVFY